MRLRISARKSDLARLQAYTVGEALCEKHPHLKIEYRFKESLGDKNLTDPLWKIPEKGVFTEDFRGELLQNETDLVVHSWKDLPTEAPSDTQIVATLPRADQRDLLVVKKSHLERIRQSGELHIYSSSPRREYNLKGFLQTHFPCALKTVRFESVRGNIPTRIRKLLESSETDGLIVAKAALDRLLSAPQKEFNEVKTQLRSYLDQLNWMVLPLSVNPNAAAQGALAVEVATHRTEIIEIVKTINHAPTFAAAELERQQLRSYGGGCHQKIGVAYLHKPYGLIHWLRGETDQGQVLNASEVLHPHSPPQFPTKSLWCDNSASQRQALSVRIPDNTEALYVARADAWPQDLKFNGFVWAAGSKTWKKLAEQGIWVHGCSDGMGEDDDLGMDVLVGHSVRGLKLSHQEAQQGATNWPLLATYNLELSEVSFDPATEFYFWSSGSRFLAAVKQNPQMLTKYHASGPGHTHQTICEYLQAQGQQDPGKVWVFLNEDDWRRQCTKE